MPDLSETPAFDGRDRLNAMDMYDDFEMWYRFRFHRQKVLELMYELSDATDHPLPRKGSLPPVMQVLVTLKFYATVSLQTVVGGMFGNDRATVSGIIHRVSRALSATRHHYIHPQTQEEQSKAMINFYPLGGFPNVTECVNYTHVNIIAPRNNENVYINIDMQ